MLTLITVDCAIVKLIFLDLFRIIYSLRASNLKSKFESRSEFVAATLEVHQVNVGGNGQITSGEFAGVAKSESSRVHQFVLGGNASASSGLVGNSHACSVSRVVGRDSHDGLVIELVEDGEGGITVASRFEDSVDVTLLHGKCYVLAGASAFLDAVTSGETKIKVFVGKNSVHADLW